MKLTKHLEEVTDFKMKGRCLLELAEILILLETLYDCNDFLEIQDWGFYGNAIECIILKRVGF